MHPISAEESMAEPRDGATEPPNYDETRRPENPPNSLLTKAARRGALYSSLGPVVVLVVVMAIGLAYWNARRPSPPERPDRDSAVGTSGETTPGGAVPQPRPDSTAAELKYRGGTDPAQGPTPPLHDRTPITKIEDVAKNPNDAAGRAVDFDNVTVERTAGDAFWVRDGKETVQVIAAPGITLEQGAHVRVIGVVETAESSPRVRASKVETR